MTRDRSALRLPPNPSVPQRPPWPGWTGVRRGPDHTTHANHRDREESR